MYTAWFDKNLYDKNVARSKKTSLPGPEILRSLKREVTINVEQPLVSQKKKILSLTNWKESDTSEHNGQTCNRKFGIFLYPRLLEDRKKWNSSLFYPDYIAQFLDSMNESKKSSWTQQTESLRYQFVCCQFHGQSTLSVKLTVTQIDI